VVILPLIVSRGRMPQLQLPIFPDAVTYITKQLAFKKKDGQLTYFNGHARNFSGA
jgi:hypothetical protein